MVVRRLCIENKDHSYIKAWAIVRGLYIELSIIKSVHTYRYLGDSERSNYVDNRFTFVGSWKVVAPVSGERLTALLRRVVVVVVAAGWWDYASGERLTALLHRVVVVVVGWSD